MTKVPNNSEKNKSTLYVLLLLVILAVSAFTHLWNPVGFPTIHVDEGHYMRKLCRSCKVLVHRNQESLMIIFMIILTLVNYF